MYPLPEFRETDPAVILDFIRRHSLGMISAVDAEGKIQATHIPFVADETAHGLVLRGHVMRKTAYWHALHHADEVHIAFTGPDAPVLESWNAKRPFGGTWNYMAVHLRGTVEFMDDQSLINLLRDLKDLHEVDQDSKFENLPEDYVPGLLKAVDGFVVRVHSTEAVFKLSQNRNREGFERIAAKLLERGGESALVADEMLSRKELLFPREST